MKTKANNFVTDIAALFGPKFVRFSEALEMNHSTVVEWAKKGAFPKFRDDEICRKIKAAAKKKKLPKASRDNIAKLLAENVGN